MFKKFLKKYDNDMKRLFTYIDEKFYKGIVKTKLFKDDEHIKHIINSINLNN